MLLLNRYYPPRLLHLRLNTSIVIVTQLATARLSEQGVPSSILGDFNVCFHFPLIRVAIALNTRKTEH